jgi:hypothetical protein
MRAAFDFGLLIAPIEPARFIAEFWEKRPLVVARQSPDYYSNLCSLADIEVPPSCCSASNEAGRR